jgi:drug/metabolite transporter (DMT)-like permease
VTSAEPDSRPGGSTEPPITQTTPVGIAAALGAVVAWGIGNVVIVDVPLGGLALAFHRLWIAAVIYVVALYATGGRLSLDSFRYGLAGSVAFSLDIAAFFLAVKHTTLADATTINALQPVVILLFAGALFGERVRPRHIICTAIAIVGVAAVVQGSRGSGSFSVFGDVMAVLSLFAWAGYFIASKRARRHLGTLEYMTVIFIGGIPILGVLGLASGQLTGSEGRLDWTAFAWVLLVIALPGSGHLLINWAHNHTTITLCSLLTLLMPVISTAGAAIWLDQPVHAIQVVGIGIVLLSLALVILGDARAGSTAIEVELVEEGPHG